MSEETRRAILHGVRMPVSLGNDPVIERRTLDERLFVRFPGVYPPLSRFLVRMPLRSRLRRSMLRRAVRRGYAAANRRDWDCLHLVQDPAIEMRINFRGGLFPPDMEQVHHGHEGYREMWERAIEAFEDLRLEPEEVIDFGDRFIVAIHHRGHGSTSGVPVDQQVFQVFFLRRGLIVRQDDFADRSEALEAAGMSE